MKKINIKYLMLVICDIAVAVVATIFSFKTKQEINNWKTLIGVLIIFSSLPHLCIFVIQGGIKNKRIVPFFALSIFGVALGFLSIYLEKFSLDEICLSWGIFDIVRSTYEIFYAGTMLKQRKWSELVDVSISIFEIVIAIFLIIDKFEGIKLHITALMISFILYSGKLITSLILEFKKHDSK